MTKPIFSTVLASLGLAACVAAPVAFAQQAYPSKSIRLIVPFPAGGATDLFARTVSQKLSERLGQTVVVDNKPGAGGTLGADLAAKASADGYTLLLSTTSTHSIGPNLNPKIPYDAVRDFTPISHLAMRRASCWCPTARRPKRSRNGLSTPARIQAD